MNNQYVTITPNTTTFDEWEAYSTNYTIEYAPPPLILDPYDFEFHDVLAVTTVPTWCNWTWTRLGNMSFNLAGSFDDVFTRSVSYVYEDNRKETVQYFHNVATDFAGIYQYSGHSVAEMNFEFSVRMRPLGYTQATAPLALLHTYKINMIVRANWQLANSKFTELVNSGKYVQRAAAAGLI